MAAPRPHAGWRRVILAVAVLAMGFVVVPAAEAKTPSRSPERTVKCANGKKAKIWYQGTEHVETIDGEGDYHWWELTQFAVDNKCKAWLYFEIRTDPQSESDCCFGVQVAPGANFTKTAKDVPSADTLFGSYGDPSWAMEAKKGCVDPDAGHNQLQWDIAKNGKVTSTEDCVRKYPESETKQQVCPESYDPARDRFTKFSRGTWKVASKKILKLAVSNRCDSEPHFWWRTDDGKRVALWVDPQTTFDLWKAELGSLPVKTKDGAVYFNMGRTGGPDSGSLDWFDEIWRVSAEGLPYRWHKN